jgi:uncharacterized protein YkwD
MSATPVLDAQERAMCRAINSYRTGKHLPPLKLSVALVRAAEWMSKDMAAQEMLSFDHSDSHGRSMEERLPTLGYHSATMGETIAMGESAAAATLAQWKKSPPHNAIILSKKVKVMGVGRARSPMQDWYWTADFGGTVTKTMPI